MDWGPMADFGDDRWERMAASSCRASAPQPRGAPHLVETKGVIVDVGSAAGLVGIPPPPIASKAGVVALTKSLAIEFAAAGVRIKRDRLDRREDGDDGAVALPEGVDMDLVMRNSPKLGDLASRRISPRRRVPRFGRCAQDHRHCHCRRRRRPDCGMTMEGVSFDFTGRRVL